VYNPSVKRALYALGLLVSALTLPWPVTLALVAAGAALWPAYVEGAVIFALLEGAAVPDREGFAWLPLTAAALAIAGVAEIARPLLSPSARVTI
jgi:predicted anti-sigma-YlaC factor YlaD